MERSRLVSMSKVAKYTAREPRKTLSAKRFFALRVRDGIEHLRVALSQIPRIKY